jgi:hypothetical protein
MSIAEARGALRSREEVLASGVTERTARHLVASGDLVRVHRGFYVEGGLWATLWPEGRQLLRVVAVARASPGDGPVFMHASAAALWELPLRGVDPSPVHTLILGSRHSRVAAGVVRHDAEVADSDIVERHGLRCTSLTRTVFDIARLTPLETAVCVADAALRSLAVHGQEQDAGTAELWRERLQNLAADSRRGVRQARWITEFADGRAQLPGESVSRLQLFRLGYRDVELQVPVVGSEGDQYYLDFGFRRSRVFGEFDGEGKYLEPELRSAPTAIDAVLAEKRREDDIRGVTGWGVRRWGSAHIRTPGTLAARLAAFGIHPPG